MAGDGWSQRARGGLRVRAVGTVGRSEARGGLRCVLRPAGQRQLVVVRSSSPDGQDRGAGRLARRARRRRGLSTPAGGLRRLAGPEPVSNPSKSTGGRRHRSPDVSVEVWSESRIKSVRITRGPSGGRVIRPRRRVGSTFPSPVGIPAAARGASDLEECLHVPSCACPGRRGTIG